MFKPARACPATPLSSTPGWPRADPFFLDKYPQEPISPRARPTNTAALIRSIIRNEAVQGYYNGSKVQRGLELVSEAERTAQKVRVVLCA